MARRLGSSSAAGGAPGEALKDEPLDDEEIEELGRLKVELIDQRTSQSGRC